MSTKSKGKIKVKDLQPKKDAKGGRVSSAQSNISADRVSFGQNSASSNRGAPPSANSASGAN